MNKALLFFCMVLAAINVKAADNNFWLSKPVDWNTTVNQLQLDMNGSLKDGPVSEFKATMTITLSDDCDGIIDKMIPARFPAAADFEKNDPDKWSFISEKSSTGKSYSCEFYARMADLSNPRLAAVSGTIMWEHFLLFSKFPTKGKLRWQVSGAEIRVGGNKLSLPEPDWFYDITFVGDKPPVVEMRIDTLGNWFDKALNQVKLAVMYKGPDLKKLSVKVLLPIGSKLISANTNLVLVYDGQYQGYDAYWLYMYDVDGTNVWRGLGYIQIQLPNGQRQGDNFAFEEISAEDYGGKALTTNAPYRIYIKYPTNPGSVSEADDSQMSIGPNPATERLRLNLAAEPLSLQLISISGLTCLTLDQQATSIELSQLPAGSYMIIASYSDKTIYKRFIKQ